MILELKSVDQLAPVHHALLLNDMRVADKRIGLLITSTSSC
ncbi:MAG: GxxExxY protein [Vicinamibacterales bacterium]